MAINLLMLVTPLNTELSRDPYLMWHNHVSPDLQRSSGGLDDSFLVPQERTLPGRCPTCQSSGQA